MNCRFARYGGVSGYSPAVSQCAGARVKKYDDACGLSLFLSVFPDGFMDAHHLGRTPIMPIIYGCNNNNIMSFFLCTHKIEMCFCRFFSISVNQISYLGCGFIFSFYSYELCNNSYFMAYIVYVCFNKKAIICY